MLIEWTLADIIGAKQVIGHDDENPHAPEENNVPAQRDVRPAVTTAKTTAPDSTEWFLSVQSVGRR
jgi:hypothetical protein